MKKNNLKQIGFLALSLLSMNLHGDPVTHNTAATVAGAQVRQGEETMEAREKKAFQFFMKLLTCPLEQVPAWKDFVTEIARLLEGNTKYAALCAALVKVKEANKLTIRNELMKHHAVIPKEIADTIKELGWEVRHRIKN